MPAMNGVYILLGVVASVGAAFLARWWFLERGRGALRAMRLADLATGFVTDFFDTLGIGAFAPTTAIFKLQRRMADEEIPGTLNVGHALPVVVEALIFIGRAQNGRDSAQGMRQGACSPTPLIIRGVLMLMSARVPAGSETSIPSRPDPLHSHDA